MARNEVDREDLIAEATALSQRVEMQVPGEPELVVAGWRDDGRLSIYFGPDSVYHFDADGGLRRAYAAGELFRSQGSTLARLIRRRGETLVELERYDLTADELQTFMAAMCRRIAALIETLESQTMTIVRQIPNDIDFREMLLTRLANCTQQRLSKPLTKR